MKDTLQNIIQYTAGLGEIDLIKITGSDTETLIGANAENKTLVITGSLSNPHPELIGVFGMPNLPKLKTILGFDDYDAEAVITVNKRSDTGEPETIHFATKNNDFVNDYRLMSKTVVEDKVKTLIFKGVVWNIEFEPSVASIMRLKKQASANSEETFFTTKMEKGDLKVYFGDASTHSGNFIFQSNVQGNLTKALQWPVNVVTAILSLPGDKKFRISDQGAAEITVDSGVAKYSYILPAQSK